MRVGYNIGLSLSTCIHNRPSFKAVKDEAEMFVSTQLLVRRDKYSDSMKVFSKSGCKLF